MDLGEITQKHLRAQCVREVVLTDTTEPDDLVVNVGSEVVLLVDPAFDPNLLEVSFDRAFVSGYIGGIECWVELAWNGVAELANEYDKQFVAACQERYREQCAREGT